MTIDSPAQSSTFLLPSSHTFYQAKIPCKHWQLRSLICSPSPDTIYYPTETSIYALNTATRKRARIASLPFSPRCLGARYGWVCAGGVSNGHFASIRVGELAKRQLGITDGPADMEADSEDELASGKPEVKISELGGLIVNSVTLHQPPDSNNDDDVLAILTNNDKTVRIFSLARNQVVSTLHLNIATNHASISPNGRHLVVVGDSTKVYFYHPVKVRSISEVNRTREVGGDTWTLSSDTPLTAGTKESLISTSFSPSSVYCAVASQEGSITIFDTRHLHKGPSMAIVRKIESTRPRTYAGAIRSVQFSPAPWDLLVWAEHSGRVTIADIRSDFVKRQTLDVVVDDAQTIQPEDGESRNEESSVGDEGENSIQSIQSMRSSNSPRDRDDEETEEDAATTAIADQMDRYLYDRRGEDRSPEARIAFLTREWPGYPTSATSVTYIEPPHPSYRSFSINQSAPIAHISVSTVGPASIGPPPISPAASVLRNHRERQPERDRWRQRAHEQPRRRNSVYLPNDIAPPPAPLPPPLREPTSSHSRWMERPDYEAQAELPRTTEDISQMLRNREHLGLLIAEERRRNLLRRSIHNLRRHDVSSDADDDDYIFLNGGRSENDGISITGCTLSCDGGKLYIATKKGIVEYNIDLGARRFFPVLTPR